MQMNLARPVIALAMLLVPQLTTHAAAEQAKKVKVYILSGQSNMVGIGQVTGGDARWGEEFTDTELSIDWYAGKEYDKCFNAAKKVPANFDEKYPQWKGRGYEIAGFGWWQGHKDGGEQGKDPAGVHAQRYEQNLVHLIKTLRNEFNAPDAPFVVASCGFNGGEGWEPGSSADTIFKAQMSVADPAKHPLEKQMKAVGFEQ